MRKSIALLLVLVFILTSGLPCQAAPEKLQKHLLSSEKTDIRMSADIFGDGNPLDVRVCNQENYSIVIQFYSGSQLVAQFIPQTSPRFITKARLRDDQHEEIIGFAAGGTLFTFGTLFILGTDNQGNITYLPINKELHYSFVSPNLKTDGKDLLIPFLNPYDTKITVHWDSEQQTFIAIDDLYKIPKEQRIPAPEVLSENEKTLGGFRLADRHLGHGDGVYNPKTWEHSYRYGDVVFTTTYVLHYINLIVADGPSVETACGVKVGDSATKVIEKYGEPLASEYDGLLLYEYATKPDSDNSRAVLRFAINKDSNTVEYISLRWN